MNMNKFEEIIKNNAQSYYDNGNQKLTDEEFDALVENVKQNNPNSPILSTGWGSSIVRNDKVKHKYNHVGSLDKAHNWKDISKVFNFAELKNLDISAKLDGLSCVLYIENGFVVKALTRGDGDFGIDITDKIYKIHGCQIPDRSFTGAVRGELMMSKESFNEYKNNVNPDASNQRNVTAGIINRNDIDKDIFYIYFYAYSIIGQEAYNTDNSKYNLQLSELKQWFIDNFICVAPRINLCLNENNFEKELLELKEEWEEKLFIDGVVLSKNCLCIRENNCIEQKSIAYKFDDEIVATTVTGIEWTMSKNNVYVPVVLIEPVILDNTIVKRVTGFNAKYIKDNNIREGSIVTVRKANQIIPQIVSVIEE